MDPSHKHADLVGRHRDDASCDGRELHQLDRRGILVRVRGLQVQARVVGALQLRLVRRVGRRDCFHDFAHILRVSVKRG